MTHYLLIHFLFFLKKQQNPVLSQASLCHMTNYNQLTVIRGGSHTFHALVFEDKTLSCTVLSTTFLFTPLMHMSMAASQTWNGWSHGTWVSESSPGGQPPSTRNTHSFTFPEKETDPITVELLSMFVGMLVRAASTFIVIVFSFQRIIGIRLLILNNAFEPWVTQIM